MTALEFNHQLISLETKLSRFAMSLTSNKEEAKEYFTGLDEKLTKYMYSNLSGGCDNIKIPQLLDSTDETIKTKKTTKKAVNYTSDEEDEDETIQVPLTIIKKYNEGNILLALDIEFKHLQAKQNVLKINETIVQSLM